MIRFPRITHVHELPQTAANCAALAGTAGDLLRLARAIQLRERPPVRISHALLPKTSDQEILDEDGRDLLWETFGVPVFEQLHDREGRLIAIECDAHEGLHLLAGGISDSDVCPCGKPGPRIRTVIAAAER